MPLNTEFPSWLIPSRPSNDHQGAQAFIAGMEMAQRQRELQYRQMQGAADLVLRQRMMEAQVERDLWAKREMLQNLGDLSEIRRAQAEYVGGNRNIVPKLETLNGTKLWETWRSGQVTEQSDVAEFTQFTDALKDLDGRGITAIRAVGPFSKGNLTPAHWQALDTESRRVAEVAQRTADVKNIETIRSWENQLAQAVEAGDTKTAADLRDRITRLDAQTAPPNTTVEAYGPEGGIVSRIITGRGGAGGTTGATVGAQTFFQKRLSSLESSINQIGELEKVLDPSMIGVRGVVGEAVLDRALGQFAPGLVDVKRADARTKLKATIQGMVRLISTDDRFSNEDRRRAEDALVSAGPLESYERASQTLSTLRGILARNASITARNAGTARPEWSYTPEDIAAEVQAKKMTVEQGEALLNRLYPNWKP